MSVLDSIIHYAPVVVAPFILMIYTFISAYVLKFRLPGGGLAFDYVLFTLVVLAALVLGGAI